MRRVDVRAPRVRAVAAWVGLGLSALLAYLTVRNVHFGDVWEGLGRSDYRWLVPALAMLAVTVYVKAVRWQYLFPRETRPPLGRALSALLIGHFFNAVLPARAGEAARVIAIGRSGTSRAAAAATVALERLYDVLCLLALLFIAVPWLPRVAWLRAAVLLAVALVLILVAAIVVLALYDARAVHFVLRPLRRLSFLSAERLESVGDNLCVGLAALRQPRLVLAAVFWTALAWLSLALSMWFVMRGFDLGLSPVAGLLVAVAVNLVQILPSSPAAVGAFEAATLVALQAYGVGESLALSYALVVHLLNLVPFLVVGLFLLRGSLRLTAIGPSQKRALRRAA